MSDTMQKAWVCQVCGYVHYGPEPPEECPVCGAGAAKFELEEIIVPDGAGRVHQAPLRVLVAGAGIAGVAAAEAAHQANPEAQILLVSSEEEPPYYRLNLTRLLAGEIGADELALHPAGWYAERCIELATGSEIEGLDLEQKEARLSGGRRAAFDRLVLATGARPFVPPIPGAGLSGVSALRTRQDALRILAAAPGRECVVIGGGLLGLETAGALARQGARVSLLENQEWLLPRQLNRRGGELLRGHVERLGINLLTGARVKEILGAETAEAVLLEDGTRLAAGLVIFSAGVRANTALARAAGLAVNQGILVDEAMRTSRADVFAAGDCAEHSGVLYGTWAPAQSQGAVAGANAAGQAASFQPLPRAHTLKVLGVDLFSIGQIAAQEGARIVEGGQEAYTWLHFEGGVLSGAILLGDASLAARVKKAVESRRDFSALLTTGVSVEEIQRAL